MQTQVAPNLDNCLPESELSDEELLGSDAVPALVQDALIWCSLHGLLVGDKDGKNSGVTPGVGLVHAPVSLLPTPFPRPLFEQAVEVAPIFNELVDKVSQDSEFLFSTLERARKTDSFTAGLLDIYRATLDKGIKEDIRLGLHRSDYMLDKATGGLLQIELNTISSSFAALGTQVSRLHRHIVNRAGARSKLEPQNVPENASFEAMTDGIAEAWRQYGDDEAVVLFVVQPAERNMYDQLWMADRLWDAHGIRSVRRTLTEIEKDGALDGDRTLSISGQRVSVVYFRAGYTPTDYPSDTEWRARLLMEESSAVKCPSISYHLTGAKKIQQELARPGVLERFITNEKDAALLRRHFAGLWALEGEGSEEIIEKAIADPEGFVLKPQREGGGNNIYGSDVPAKLQELQGTDGLAAYILMQRIFPPVKKSYLLRGGEWSQQDTLSELGIFGTYLRNGEKVVINQPAGHLLRTKTASSNEGGVAAGYGVIDSPYLTSK
ncbi:glutathione synthetase [Klebsormidium nitens]|uniref:Glutathione synthetase n=1 Tax=Klebsormidium nitens TaxID=105231 RepID=A0A0U9HIG4_KLENI|nr:glutathione synthetase [Klebsormidium nitens]|eukprot:GAQ79430.1 glutathione synthetase [Klebsormidium nitens]